MRDIFRLLGEALRAGEGAVLATVVASSGSTPRGAGASMLVTPRGRVAGTVGGGAVEHRSEQMAREVLRTGNSRLEFYRLHKNEVQDLGMICGGDVHIYFRHFAAGDQAALALADRVEALFRSGEQSWLISDITPDAGGVLGVWGADSGPFGIRLPENLVPALVNRAVQIQGSDGHLYYSEPLVQAGTVYIFGGGHVSQALVPALAAVKFRCVVLDDREEFCDPARFPGAAGTLHIDINRIADAVTVGPEDYGVVMTRGHKDDQAVQAQLLRTPACYIGVIGSRKKTAGVFANLREMGFTKEDLQRISTPIGLDIQAETPEEIAVSIAAQLIQTRARRRAG